MNSKINPLTLLDSKPRKSIEGVAKVPRPCVQKINPSHTFGLQAAQIYGRGCKIATTVCSKNQTLPHFWNPVRANLWEGLQN